MIATYKIPHNVLSVTAVLGYDTIFRDTPLSEQLGLELGNPIPSELAEADILLWVESSILETGQLSPGENWRVRSHLGVTQERFASQVGLHQGGILYWEISPGVATFVEGGLI